MIGFTLSYSHNTIVANERLAVYMWARVHSNQLSNTKAFYPEIPKTNYIQVFTIADGTVRPLMTIQGGRYLRALTTKELELWKKKNIT